MGAGKTRIGKLVADALGRPFLDTDDLVEERAGRPISEIFANDGEPAFRALESDAVAEALSCGPGVVALGGGAATVERNWELLARAMAVTVYLRADAETIVARVAEHGHRPLLAGLDRPGMLAKIRSMLEAREPWYRRAVLVIDTDNALDKYGTADAILARLKEAGIE